MKDNQISSMIMNILFPFAIILVLTFFVRLGDKIVVKLGSKRGKETQIKGRKFLAWLFGIIMMLFCVGAYSVIASKLKR